MAFECTLGFNFQYVLVAARLSFLFLTVVVFCLSLNPAFAAARRSRRRERRSLGLLHPLPRLRQQQRSLPIAFSTVLLLLSFYLLHSYCFGDLQTFYQRLNPPHTRRLPDELTCQQIRKLPLKRPLGRGFYASVFESELESGQRVALKTPDPEDVAFTDGIRWHAVRSFFAEEVRLLRSLNGNNHIVQLLGACGSDMVLELLYTGLDGYLYKRAEQPLPFVEVLSLSLGVARAVEALHSAPGGSIIHTDLRPEQFMLAVDGSVKLVDLNRAYQLRGDWKGICRPGATGRYKAPEELHGGLVTPKVDVYAMGLTFYGILTRSVPFGNLTTVEAMTAVEIYHLRPKIPEKIPEAFAKVIKECWAEQPEDRPNAETVAGNLERLLAQFANGHQRVMNNDSLEVA